MNMQIFIMGLVIGGVVGSVTVYFIGKNRNKK